MYSVKIFAPTTLLAFMVLVPINWTGKTLEAPAAKGLTFSDIDKLSISNIPFGSKRCANPFDKFVQALYYSLFPNTPQILLRIEGVIYFASKIVHCKFDFCLLF